MSAHIKDWGRGQWHSIHTTAARATTTEKFKFFCSWIRDQLEDLPCEECTEHSKEYLKSNPPEKAEDAFIWTWRFHNAVNRRLGKPEMEYTTAKQIYLEGGMKNCKQGCGGGAKPPTQVADTFNFRSSRF